MAARISDMQSGNLLFPRENAFEKLDGSPKMSCVLRVSAAKLGVTLTKLSLRPYRIDGEIGHFCVSEAEFSNLAGQIHDAISFLRANKADLMFLMHDANAKGELDFALEMRDAAFQSVRLPSELVCLAGELRLALTLSHYPVSENCDAERR